MKNKIKMIFALTLNAICLSSCNKTNIIINGNDNEEIALKNNLKNLDIKGYVGRNFKNNINYWQKVAYKDNPNIITQIKEANIKDQKTSLSHVLGSDYFGVEQYFDIDLKKKDNKQYIGWTMKSIPDSFKDRDIRFSNDPNAKTDWTGAKELLVYIDNSEIDGITDLRIAFEENHIGRESYSLIEGSKVYLESDSKRTEIVVKKEGSVDIPKNFKGYLCLPLNEETFEYYWNEGGNRKLEIDNVVQFQIAVKGTQKNLSKTFYLNDFKIRGEFENNEDEMIIWNIEGLKERNTSGSEPSSLAWYGEFVGKLLTGIAFSYRATNDQELVSVANEIINDLEKAQGEDGYLGTYRGKARYSIGSSNWDLWNQYHCVVGLLEWYKETNNEKALNIAKKALDCILKTFKDRSYIVAGGFETNRGIAHGFALMYQVTREEKYLNEAIRIIEKDCKDYNGWYYSALTGKHFYTSSSARWEVLHMIMTLGILYEETGKEEYYEVLSYMWHDILETDIHNDGGFTTNEGAIGDPYIDGVIETCCTIAWSAFTNEYYRLSKEVEVVDELERSYFNALLGSLLDDDKYCTYNTPMDGIQGTCGHYDGRRVTSQQDISFQFNSGSKDMNCCQANLARGIGQISEWAILSDNDSLYFNYYGNSTITSNVGESEITFEQITSYPLNGDIKINVKNIKNPAEFTLKLRIPSWCDDDNKVIINGEEYVAEAGKYFSITKKWSNSDKINLKLDYNFNKWDGERNKEGKTSVYYGPILLTFDEYYQNNSTSVLEFENEIKLDANNFKNAKISNASGEGAWMFVDIPYESSFIRLCDFSSAGKYNGNSQPSSYYSWLKINNTKEVEVENIENRWKVNLY